MSTQAEKRKYLAKWKAYRDNAMRNTPVDLHETESAKRKRMARLEKDPEAWFRYYFPHFYQNEPAPFHIAATKRVINNPEWYEVRSWSRELAKTTRTMMEVFYLTLTGRKKNVLLVSNSYDNAVELLLPYKANLEKNQRIIHDYGEQFNIGQWEAGKFVTKNGVSFRAIGAGQSPRGTKNEADRPDIIIIDDIDTDKEVRNKDLIRKKVEWLTGALYGTRSINKPLLWIALGNIIAKYCSITEMGKLADKWDIVNIRDKNGRSTWPQKNTEEHIDRVLSKIPWRIAQREYFNNPVSEGTVFKQIHYARAPKPSLCDAVLIYADPGYSNRASKQSSYKAIVALCKKAQIYYVLRVWLEQTGNSRFVDVLFDMYKWLIGQDAQIVPVYIENNALQRPFYEQVILPTIKEKNRLYGLVLPVKEDTRKKPAKYDRIEGTLEPLNRMGYLFFDSRIRGDQYMQIMEEQMLAVSPDADMIDGPDALEGGVWILQHKYKGPRTYAVGYRPNRKF